MADDEPGLLGNLPRSRPGTRSTKRTGAPDPATVAAEAQRERARTADSKPAPARPKAKKPATKRPAPAPAAQTRAPRPEPPAREAQQPAGPLRSAAKVAETGLRVAEGVTREVLRRLPRP